MPTLSHIAASLVPLQRCLYDMHPRALHWLSRCFLRTPDGFSREMKESHGEMLEFAMAHRAALQAELLCVPAANDARPSAA